MDNDKAKLSETFSLVLIFLLFSPNQYLMDIIAYHFVKKQEWHIVMQFMMCIECLFHCPVPYYLSKFCYFVEIFL
jgi:hypothetical protein